MRIGKTSSSDGLGFLIQTVGMVFVVGALTMTLKDGDELFTLIYTLGIIAYTLRWVPSLLRGCEHIGHELLSQEVSQ